MFWTDAKINDVCEPGTRLINPEFQYINKLIVEDMRNDYELALTIANNRLAAAAAEIERLQAQVMALVAALVEAGDKSSEQAAEIERLAPRPPLY